MRALVVVAGILLLASPAPASRHVRPRAPKAAAPAAVAPRTGARTGTGAGSAQPSAKPNLRQILRARARKARSAVPTPAPDPKQERKPSRLVRRQGTRPATTARLITTPDASVGARIATIRSARSEINLSSFIFADDRVGRGVVAELMRASSRGVRVRLLLDGVGHRLSAEALDLLLSSGVEVKLYNPPRLVSLLAPQRLSYRMHDKLLSVDGKQAIVGGRNVEDGYYGIRRRGAMQFEDTDVHVTGKVSSSIDGYFNGLWNSRHVQAVDHQNLSKMMKRKNAFGALMKRAERQLNGRTVTFMADAWAEAARSPAESIRFIHEGSESLRKDQRRTRAVVLKLLQRAKSSVDIQNPYVIPDRRLLKAIHDATQRGVTVRITTNSKTSSDGFLVQAAYESSLSKLARAGAEVWEVEGTTMLHAKTVVADDHKVFIGSHNLDPRSDRLNREVGVLMRSRELAAHLANSGALRRASANLVATGGRISPFKRQQCGLGCRLTYSVVGGLLRMTGAIGQL